MFHWRRRRKRRSRRRTSSNVDFALELDTATAQLKAKFAAGKTNATDLQENLTAINALIVKHLKDGKREQLARLYCWMRIFMRTG